jgi:signal transduction histidine kinase/HPt (histidine-containing phosphotransfer) domain-containing protein/AmiR/NasT family two-component response regulator
MRRVPPPARSRASWLALLREQRTRAPFVREDGRQAAVVMGAVAAAYVVSTPNDLLVLRGSPLLIVSLASRAALALAAGVVLVLLRRARRPRELDRATNLGLAATAIFVSTVHLTEIAPGRIQAPLLAGGAYLIGLYFAQRGPVGPRAVAGGVTTLVGATLVVLGNAQGSLEPTARHGAVIALVALNVVGVVSARAFEAERRRRCEAERALRLRLVDLADEKDRAESISRGRMAFLAAMSHEFRTPMNAVIGLSDLLLDRPLDPADRAWVRTINDSARALLRLVGDVLDFAKIDARMLTLSPAPFVVEGLCAAVADMMGPAAGARGLGFVVEVGPEVPACVLGDDARLRQVLLNLVANAVKFTDEGSITLRVSARPCGQGEHDVSFRVEDTGMGMEPEVLGRIFRPFEQADPGRARRRAGTGLGLAISTQIVAAMGGDLRAESAKGRGSTFSFTVRLAAVAPPVRRSSAPTPARSRPPLSVLVVDDHPVNREVARAKLDRLGYAVDLAGDGAAAIEAAAQRAYDVVFMDLHMPGMSGLEATARIREARAGRRAPHVVAMTASVAEEDREACRGAGMLDFIGKPIDLAQLDAVLRRVAEARGAAVPAPPKGATLSGDALAGIRQVESLGESGFFESLCRIFLAETRERLPRMREALARGDAPEVAREAHPLRSASASLGAMEMAEICARVEREARAGRLDELGAGIDALAAQLGEVERALAQEQRGGVA